MSIFLSKSEGKVMELFFKQPLKHWYVREISRVLNVSTRTASITLKKLKDKNLITNVAEDVKIEFRANLGSPHYKILKLAYTLIELNDLFEYIDQVVYPNFIILFGSASRGEDTEKGDVDVFVNSQRVEEVDEKKREYEKKINRKINILFEEDVNSLSDELKKTLMNGYVVRGYFDMELR